MHRVFNCGIGMAVVVAVEDLEFALDFLQTAGETAWDIGQIQTRKDNQPQTVVE
jgi:phosphoribosylformylglycinamidine cyclo-ligase